MAPCQFIIRRVFGLDWTAAQLIKSICRDLTCHKLYEYLSVEEDEEEEGGEGEEKRRCVELPQSRDANKNNWNETLLSEELIVKYKQSFFILCRLMKYTS